MSQEVDVRRALQPRWLRDLERDLEHGVEALERAFAALAREDPQLTQTPQGVAVSGELLRGLVHARNALLDLQARRST